MKESIKDLHLNYRQKVLEFLETREQPTDVEKIRRNCGIKNWNTALKHCLELLIEARISGQKSSKSWIFWSNID